MVGQHRTFSRKWKQRPRPTARPRFRTAADRAAPEVKRIAAEDPTARVILFAQWEGLLRRIAAALRAFGIQSLGQG